MPSSKTGFRPYLSDNVPANVATNSHTKGVGALSCPATATVTPKSSAISTSSGPIMRMTSSAVNRLAAAKRTRGVNAGVAPERASIK